MASAYPAETATTQNNTEAAAAWAGDALATAINGTPEQPSAFVTASARGRVYPAALYRVPAPGWAW